MSSLFTQRERKELRVCASERDTERICAQETQKDEREELSMKRFGESKETDWNAKMRGEKMNKRFLKRSRNTRL